MAVPDIERKNAMLSHLLAIFIGLISPLIFLKDKKQGFDYENAMHVFNFKVSMAIYYLFLFLGLAIVEIFLFYAGIGMKLMFLFIFLGIMLLMWIFELIVGIVGTVRSNNGIVYSYPFTIQFNLRWNPFMIVPPAFQKAKELLIPFKIKYWMKLGFVSIFSMYGASRGGGGNNIRLPSDSFSSSSVGNQTAAITGNAVSALSKYSIIGGIVGIVSLLVIALILVMNYIVSSFTFVFVEALVKKEYTISGSWKNNSGKSVSLFWFRIFIAIFSLAVIGLISLLPILKILSKGGFTAYFANSTFTAIIKAFLPYWLLLILWIIILSLFIAFVVDFSIPDLYKNSQGITAAIKNTFANIKMQKLESLVYLYTKSILNAILGLIAGLAGIVVFILGAIIALIIGLIIYFILAMFSKVLAIVVVIIFGVAALLLLIYIIYVVVLPIRVFVSYFSLLIYEKVHNTRLFN